MEQTGRRKEKAPVRSERTSVWGLSSKVLYANTLAGLFNRGRTGLFNLFIYSLFGVLYSGSFSAFFFSQMDLLYTAVWPA